MKLPRPIREVLARHGGKPGVRDSGGGLVLDRRHLVIAFLPSVEHVRPLLHHFGAVRQVPGVVSCSDIEQKVHDIPILHDVFLAFFLQFSFFPGALFALEGDEVVI